jgi:tRNA pseudouridine38-40 synthase
MSWKRHKLTIAFDGTGYAGWQRQKTGLAVQAVVEVALADLLGSRVVLHGSSRTDAGVHALGMVAHLDMPVGAPRIPCEKLPLALNARLPEDVRVVRAERVPEGFHARFGASGKEYRYQVWNARVMNPLLARTAWHVPVALDPEAMRRAAAAFVGRHDFRSMAANHGYRIEDTVRTVRLCQVRRVGELITFRIRGDGFLYKMCRGMVGTLVQVGQGKIGAEDVGRILEQKDRRVAGVTAPACGLVLWKVFYRNGGVVEGELAAAGAERSEEEE